MAETSSVIFVKWPIASAAKSSQRMLPGEKPLASQTLIEMSFSTNKKLLDVFSLHDFYGVAMPQEKGSPSRQRP